jgi:hypothetical protein
VKLVIEVDGESHATEQGQAYDQEKRISPKVRGIGAAFYKSGSDAEF